MPLNRNYPFNTMNDLVYPVHGGLEDWGYGASWDTAFVKPCTPRTYGGYPAAKTSAYPEGAVRAFTVLVETSDSKHPPAQTYGGEEGVYAPDSAADGHVPRNVRLALAGIDLVAPYVETRRTLPAEPVVAGACMPLEWIAWGAISVEASSPVCR